MTFRPSAALALLALLALAPGCGVAGKQPDPAGDVGGEHLLVFATDRTGGGDVAPYDLDAGGYRSLPNLNTALLETEPSLPQDGTLITFSRPRPARARRARRAARRKRARADTRGRRWPKQPGGGRTKCGSSGDVRGRRRKQTEKQDMSSRRPSRFFGVRPC